MSKSPKIDLTNPERLDLFLRQAAEIHNRIAEAVAVTNKLTASIDKLTIEIQNLTTRLAIERRAPPSEQPKAGLVCKDWTRKDGTVKRGCGAPVRWGKIDGRSVLLNAGGPNDGTKHVC